MSLDQIQQLASASLRDVDDEDMSDDDIDEDDLLVCYPHLLLTFFTKISELNSISFPVNNYENIEKNS